MNEVVRQLQSVFGKRAVLRNHRVAQPSDAPRDRVRYLTELAALNAEFVANVSDFAVPTSASGDFRGLLAAVDTQTRLMTSYVSRPEMSFDVLGMRLDYVEEKITQMFLSLLAALDPASVTTVIRVNDTE